MSAEAQIESNIHRPLRRLWIKRKLVTGLYETNWQRVDTVDGEDQVIEWGTVTYEIDADPSTEQSTFDISGVTVKIRNDQGLWNNEKSSTSLFFPDDVYLTRKFTKIKIEAGYIDADEEEQGVCTIFEGLIESVSVSEDRAAIIKAMSYLYVLKNYPISDRAYTATTADVSVIISDIFGLTKVSNFIYLDTNTPALDGEIADKTTLEGDYWQVIQRLAFLSNSVPVLVGEIIGGEANGQSFKFIPRAPVGASKRTFYGSGTSAPDIYSIDSYDDEGAKRVVLRWNDDTSSLFAQSSNTSLKEKYLNKTSEVDVSNLSNADRQPLLNALLSYWEYPRESLTFSCKTMLNNINVMDLINISIPGVYPEDCDRWGFGVWGEVVGSAARAGLIIDIETQFLVTSVSLDLDNWKTTIKCERV